MRRTSLLSALLAAAFVLTSCTALYYPGDDYLNGPIDAAPSAPESSTDGPADAPSDGPMEATGPLVCPPDKFCDDFERSGALGPLWSTVSGNVAIDTNHAHSPTRSLSATTVSGGDASYLQQSGNVTARTRFDFWIYTPKAPPGGGQNFRIAQFLWGNDCDWDLTWELIVNADQGLFVGAAAYDKNMNASCGPIANEQVPISLTPAELFTNRWHHVVIIGDTSKQARVVLVDVDDTGTFTSVTVNSSRSTVPTTASAAIGIPCVRTNGGCFTYSGPDYQVWIDDLIAGPD